MKILILGADGYLGWAMAASLSEDNHELILVDNYSKRKYMKELKRSPLCKMPLVTTRLKILKRLNKNISFYELINELVVDENLVTLNITAPTGTSPFSSAFSASL